MPPPARPPRPRAAGSQEAPRRVWPARRPAPPQTRRAPRRRAGERGTAGNRDGGHRGREGKLKKRKRVGGGEKKNPPDPGAGGGRDPFPFLLPLPHSFLPRSFTRPLRARSPPPRSMPLRPGPRRLGAAGPSSLGSRCGRRRTNLGSSRKQGWWLRAAAADAATRLALRSSCHVFWLSRQLPGKENKKKKKKKRRKSSFKFPFSGFQTNYWEEAAAADLPARRCMALREAPPSPLPLL